MGRFGCVHMDRPIRALIRTLLAADAPAFNPDFAIAAQIDGAHWATGHANGIETSATRERHQIFLDPRSFEIQSRVTVVVTVDAGIHTFATPRTSIKVDQHELLALNEPQSFEVQCLSGGRAVDKSLALRLLHTLFVLFDDLLDVLGQRRR